MIVVIAFLLLALAIVTNCAKGSVDGISEGFKTKIVPAPTALPTNGEPKGLTDIGDLPAAPIVGLAETNSRPFQDPALSKATEAQLNELRKDMDGFAAFELPGLDDKSDPAVKLPLTRFKGDYQRIKDETLTLARNPGIQSQLTLDDLQGIAANLRFLQRTYRLYSANSMVPDAKGGLSKFGIDGVEGFTSELSQEEEFDFREGFTTNADATTPITPDEVRLLSQKLAVEIARLQASASTDPVLTSRVSVLTKIRQSVEDINTKLTNGTLPASQIPIMKSDYNNFLPALGNVSSGPGGLISRSGNETLSSLFNNYDQGDASGADIAAFLFEKYADDLIKGSTFSFSYKYTGKNEVTAEKARADQVTGIQSILASGLFGSTVPGFDTNHPGTEGVRGEFDRTVRQMDVAAFTGASAGGGPDAREPSSWSGRPPAEAAANPGSFDWKKKVEEITQNISRAGMDPKDFGALSDGSSVGQDYSWRGHAKMICNRLATTADPGIPEQMGCPPVNWKGWRQ
jgi:hypothetical protein